MLAWLLSTYPDFLHSSQRRCWIRGVPRTVSDARLPIAAGVVAAVSLFARSMAVVAPARTPSRLPARAPIKKSL